MKKSLVLLFILASVWNIGTIKAQEGNLIGNWMMNLNRPSPQKSEIKISISKDSLILQTPSKDGMQTNYFSVLAVKYLDEFKSYLVVESLYNGSPNLKFGIFLFLTLKGKELFTPGFVFQSPSKEESLKKFEAQYASSQETLFWEGNFILKKEGFYAQITQYPAFNPQAMEPANLLKALESISLQMDSFPIGKIKDPNKDYPNENIFYANDNIFKMRVHWGLEYAGFNPYTSSDKFNDLLTNKDSYTDSNPEIYKILTVIEGKK